MELQFSDVAMENSNTNRIETTTLIKYLHPKDISGTLPRRWDKIKEQSSTALKPNELLEQMEPITLSSYNGQSKGPCTKYVMETTLSHISFQIRLTSMCNSCHSQYSLNYIAYKKEQTLLDIIENLLYYKG